MNTPNKITVCRLCLTFLLIIIFSLSYIPGASESWASELVIGGFHFGFSWIDFVSAILFGIAATTDAIDGNIARKRGLVTNLGKFLDPLADKFLVDTSFVLLSTRLDWSGHYQIYPFFVVLFIGRDLAVDGLRTIANGRGRVLEAKIYGKIKTAIQMAVIPILFLKGFPFSMLNVTNGLDNWMASRWNYTYIVTNALSLVALCFSLISMVFYFVKNKDVLQEEKK